MAKKNKKKVALSLTNIHGIGATLSKSKSKAVKKIAAIKLSKYGWKKVPKRKTHK